MRFALLSLLLVVPVALAEDKTEPKDTKVTAREIAVKGLPVVRGQLKDTKLASKEEMEKAIGDEDARKEIAKKVNFAKEYLVLLQWAGSGQDKMEFKTEKDKVTFTRLPGRTRDLRQHAKLFAIPKDSKYEMGK